MTSVDDKYFVSAIICCWCYDNICYWSHQEDISGKLKIEYIARVSSSLQIMQNLIRSPGFGSIIKLELTFPAMYLTSQGQFWFSKILTVFL